MENFRLKVFRVVAAHQNFSRAAEELLLTQPAVTQQIRQLEKEYGVPLFDRQRGRIKLTEAGKTLLPYAERLKDLSDEAFAAVASAGGEQAGHLVIGASQTIGRYLLPKLIAGFLHDNPRVNITAVSGNSDEMLEAVMARRTHIALIEKPELSNEVRIEPFMEDELALVVPVDHEWADHEIEIDALKNEPFLMREFGSGSRHVVEQALSHAGLSRKSLHVRMELDSIEGLLNAVEARLGVTFVSRWAARNKLSLGTLRLTRVHGLKLTRMFSLAYPSGHEPTGNAAEFRFHLLTRSSEFAQAETDTTSEDLTKMHP